MEWHFIFFGFFYHDNLVTLRVYILNPSSKLSYKIVLQFNLYNESKIIIFANKNGRPDMVTRKESNKKFIQ